jgi:hypothetical protein
MPRIAFARVKTADPTMSAVLTAVGATGVVVSSVFAVGGARHRSRSSHAPTELV